MKDQPVASAELRLWEMDPITTLATIVGPETRAWQIDLTAARDRARLAPDAVVAHWLIEAPWAHPVWHSYSIVCVHLRPQPDQPLKIYMDGATHEMLVLALSPKGARQRLLEYAAFGCHGAPQYLTPINFAAQFIEITDELASDRVTQAVELVCTGALSPDQDHVSQWVRLFGANMIRRV